MKKLTILLLLALNICSAKAQSPELLKVMSFENLQPIEKADYGTKSNPILSGAFININDRTKMTKLMNSYRWPDGQRIDFSRRGSVRGSNDAEILDLYTLVRPGSTDTVRLFVNPYKISDQYFVPKGLVAINSTMLKKELEPYLALVEELEASKDAINMKEQASKLLTYLSSALGTTPFVDASLKDFIEDKEIDPALKSFLFRAYLFNKFYAYGKGIENERSYALSRMKSNFEEYLAFHPNVKTGSLASFFK